VPFLSFFPVALAFSPKRWHGVTIVGRVLAVRVQAAAVSRRRTAGLLWRQAPTGCPRHLLCVFLLSVFALCRPIPPPSLPRPSTAMPVVAVARELQELLLVREEVLVAREEKAMI
jgi:hypothetical protein